MKYLKLKHSAFSTIEALISAVILSLVMLFLFEAIGKTMDHDKSLTIIKGLSKVEEWRGGADSLLRFDQIEALNFEGGRVDISKENDPRGFSKVSFFIRNQSKQTVFSWTEIHIIQ